MMQRMMRPAAGDRRRYLWMASFTAFYGVIAFLGVCTKPRFATMHVLDVIRLMTAGAGFALTVMALIMFFNRERPAEDRSTGERGLEGPG